MFELNQTHMNKRIIYSIGLLILIAIIVAVWALSRNNSTNVGVSGEPVDVVSDFYSAWFNASLSTTTNPYDSVVAVSPALSEEMRERLQGTQEDAESYPDLCGATASERFRAKSVFETEDEAQILVLPGRETGTGQALVSLSAVQNGWLITDISCEEGESAPEREFTFEQEGTLLKDVSPPLDSQYWHLVFEEGADMEQTIPLFFDASSICVDQSMSDTVCETDMLVQGAKVFVQGDLTEEGLEVKQLQVVQ